MTRETPATKRERERFELWITSPPYEMDVTRNSQREDVSAWPGQYQDIHVQLAWESWKEAATYDPN
jgi:hypothetical protein